MKKVSIWLLAAMAAGVLAVTSCNDDDPVPTNEEELITTLRLTFSAAGKSTAVWEFKDADGDGGGAPVITMDTLEANTAYSVAVELLNESISPAEDIGAEVEAEGEAHQLFVLVEPAGLFSALAYTDADANSDPIGLAFGATTGASGSGAVTVTLRHEPSKGVAYQLGDAIPSGVGGETDVEVLFEKVVIQ